MSDRCKIILEGMSRKLVDNLNRDLQMRLACDALVRQRWSAIYAG